MNFIYAVSLIALSLPSHLLAQEETADYYLRRTQGKGNAFGNGNANGNGNGNAFGRRKATLPCLTVLSDIQFEDGHDEDTPLECELQGTDLNGEPYKMMKVKNLPSGFQKRDLISSVSTIYTDGAEIDETTGEYILPANAKVLVGRKNDKFTAAASEANDFTINNRHLAVTTGKKRVLILRVKAADAETTATPEQLADDIFGSSGDKVNLKSQYAACSDDQLIFDKVINNPLAGEHSVYTVSIPNVVAGATDSTIRTSAVNQATADFGTALTNVADHVMVCIPPGTSGGWIAYAYINHWLSVYNNDWCRYPSGQMHEIGHNLNLAHAGEAAAYDDQSGMMGYSYGQDEGPLMCFNGAKTWQLGWYSEFHQDLQSGVPDFAWNGNLIGFVDKDNAGIQDKMIVRIRSEIVGKDIYIHFNRKTGFNAGTVEGGDQVMITTRAEGLGYATSKLEVKLSVGGVYEMADFDGDGDFLVITFTSLNKSVSPWRANVSVQSNRTPPLTQQPAMTPTLIPVEPPTSAPVPPPTTTPIVPPTSAPVPLPTFTPVVPPTSAPVPPPTTEPVVPPTSPPVQAPTTAPVVPPTFAPVPPPTTAPVVPPTFAPVPPPAAAPIAPPTSAPVPPPTAAPVVPPTATPVLITQTPVGDNQCNDNGICEAGEDCDSCPRDCRAKHSGRWAYCCVGGFCDNSACNGRQGKDQWICVKGGFSSS